MRRAPCAHGYLFLAWKPDPLPHLSSRFQAILLETMSPNRWSTINSLFVWLIINDRKFSAGTVFFFHINQPVVLLYEPATIWTSQPNRLKMGKTKHKEDGQGKNSDIISIAWTQNFIQTFFRFHSIRVSLNGFSHLDPLMYAVVRKRLSLRLVQLPGIRHSAGHVRPISSALELAVENSAESTCMNRYH